MSQELEDWLPMSEDYHSITFNSYCNGQTAAHMPLHLLPSFGCQTSEPKRHPNVKLCIEGFPSDLTEAIDLAGIGAQYESGLQLESIYELKPKPFSHSRPDSQLSGLKTFLARIGCKVVHVKLVSSRTRVGRHICFADFESNKAAHKGIELIRAQRIYKLSVGFAISHSEKQHKDLLIKQERKEFEDQLIQQKDMKQKIDLGNHSSINSSNSNGRANQSPHGSENGSLDSSHIDMLSPLAKSDKLLKVLEKSDDKCSFCLGQQKLEHLHFILSDQQVVDPNQLPDLVEIDTKCLMCGQKSSEPKLCAQCRITVYCNQTCQSADWHKHRNNCRADNDLSMRFNSLSLNNSLSNSCPPSKVNENIASKGESEVDGTRLNNTSTPVFAEQEVLKESPLIPQDTRAGGDFIPLSKPVNLEPKVASPKKIEKSVQQKVVLAPQKKISFKTDSDEDVTPQKIPVVQTQESTVKIDSSEPSEKPQIRALETEILADGEKGVSICFGRTPSDFYLQKSNAEENMNLFYEQITSKKDEFPQLTGQDFKRGALCGGIYSVDDQCYRARIADKVDDNTFALYFIDYGNTEPVEKKSIKRLPVLFFSCKAQAIHCSLDIVPNGEEWSLEANNLFAEISESNEFSKVRIIGKVDEVYKIDLINKNGDSITKAFINKKLAKSATEAEKHVDRSPVTMPKKTNPEPPMIVETSPKVVLNKSSINEVVVPKMASLDEPVETKQTKPKNTLKSYYENINSETKLSMGIASPYNAEEFQYLGTVVDEKLVSLIQKLDQYYKGKDRQSITPSVDDIVVAKGSDGDFYRSYVFDVNQSVVQVLMFDSGYIEEVNVSDIYALDEKFNKYPVFGVLFVPVSKASARLLELAALAEDLIEGVLLKQKDKLFFKYQDEMISLKHFEQMFEFVKTTYINIRKPDTSAKPSDALPHRQLALNKKMQALALYQEENDPKVFYIAGDITQCEVLMGRCAQYGTQYNDNIGVNPLPGNVYLIKSSSDNEWYRALVVSASDEKINVIYIDFGNQEDTDSKYVMELSEDLCVTVIQPLAVRCKVETTKLSDEELKYKIEQGVAGTFVLNLEVLRIDDGFHWVQVY